MPKKRLSETFLDTLDNAASKDDVLELLNALTKVIADFKEQMSLNMAQNKGEMDTMMKEHMGEMESMYTQMEGMVKENKDLTRSESRTLMRLIEQKVNDLRDEMPDMEAEHDMMGEKIQELEDKIPVIPPQFNPSSIFQELTKLLAKVEELEKKIEELMKRPVGGAGGGVTNLRIQQAFKYILKTEEPSGLINGSNTSYTVTQPIFAILAFSLNGETIAQLPNYTIAGRTITFSSALPSAYSGKDFEVKYI